MRKISQKAVLLLLIFFTLIGFIFRISGLGQNYSFWTDEASTARFSRGVLETGVSQIPLTGHKERSYYTTVYLTALSMRIFGGSEFAARLPQVIAGTAVILAVFFLGKELFGPEAGLGAAALTTFSHLFIAWSRQARGYMLLTLFFVCSVYFLYCFSKRYKVFDLVLFAAFTLLSILTHTLAINLIPIALIFLILEKDLLKNVVRKKKLLVVPLAVLPLLGLTNFFQIIRILATEKISRLITQKEFFISYFHSLFWRQYSLITFLSFLALIFLFAKYYSSHRKQIVLLVSVLATYLFSACFLLYVPFEKYVLPLFPFFFLLTSLSLYEISQGVSKNSLVRKAVFLALLFFIVFNGNKFTIKPKGFYTLNFDVREIPEIDYKKAYFLVKTKMDKVEEREVAVVELSGDIPAWYLGEGKVDFVVRNDVPPEKTKEIGTGATFVHSLEEFKDVYYSFPFGFTTLVEHNFRFYPPGLADFVRKNLDLEYREERAGFSTDHNNWPIEVYSWGFN